MFLVACTTSDPRTRGLGAPCRDQADCERRCLPAPRWPDGFCSLDCRSQADCPVGAGCAMAGADGQVCLFLCFDDRDCGFLENDVMKRWTCGEAGFCIPK